MDPRIITIFFVWCASTQIAQSANQTISESCYNCFCYATQGCYKLMHCSDGACPDSPPTTGDKHPHNWSAWRQCVREPNCAQRTIQKFMNIHAQDCNEDGEINCDDYARIHYLGPNDCKGPLHPTFEGFFKDCRLAED